jgi:hypothetical protein
MTQKFFDNFFPRIEISRIMGSRLGKALETEMLTRESRAKRAASQDIAMDVHVARRRRARHAPETFLLRSDTRGKIFI